MPPMHPGGPPTAGSSGDWAYSPIYGWVWIPAPPSGGIKPPGNIDNTLPGAQPHPDQGLPGAQPHPDQGLPDSGNRPAHPIDPGGQPEPH
jgi:hypothetical protein